MQCPPAVRRDHSCAPSGGLLRALGALLLVVGAALLMGGAPRALALEAAPAPAPAHTPAPAPASRSGLDAALEQQVRALALARAVDAASAPAGSPRLELVLGQLDPRLRLAPCGHVEPYLPEGTRAWGKSRIGLRCSLGPVRWNVYLPITVKVFSAGWVANGAIAAGSVLGSADLSAAEVDLADDASAAVTNPAAAIGRVLARPIKAGQSLRLSHIKPRQWFGVGDLVTVVATGSGFSVAGQAQALTNGVEGQPARVRTEAGRVLTGQPVGDRRMELAL